MTAKKIVWTIVVVAAAVGVALMLMRHVHRLRTIAARQLVSIEGAVVQRDTDPNKQLPITGAVITASDGVASAHAESDASGYFKLVLHKLVLSDRPVVVTFEREGYDPLQLTIPTGRLATRKQLYVAAMLPVAPKPMKKDSRPLSVVAHVRVRYTINARTEASVGSAAKTFEVVNKGNVPCNHQAPCSPDGQWKASSGSVSLDAGPDNSFGNVRASCIAGPCPFTRIDSNGFIHGGRVIKVSALNWSDTATFLVEAEVYHTAISSDVRELYPVIFGQTLNFTMPPTQEGVSLEADLDGMPMVFPLGPNPELSWASCMVRMGMTEERSTVYRCELKPGFRFN